MNRTKRFVYAKRFEGLPKITDFQLVEEDLPELKDGDVLVEAVYFSVDPYMRAYMDRYDVGVTMIGGQIAKVLKTKNPNVKIGEYICASLGWRTHSVFNPQISEGYLIPPYAVPNFGNLPISLGLGQLGMPGNTAYFGFLEICKPKASDTVVVSGAAGAVGTLVGQIAKLKGCKVIGITGSDEKCKWLVDELGFDHAINYKKPDSISRELAQYAPLGVDCYFDNVGGKISAIVIEHMREFGRISVCGSISAYNTPRAQWPSEIILQPFFVFKQLKMEGFVVTRFWDKWFDGIEQMRKWTAEGKLKYRETVTQGFENLPQAFIGMLQGQNFGKAIVKV